MEALFEENFKQGLLVLYAFIIISDSNIPIYLQTDYGFLKSRDKQEMANSKKQHEHGNKNFKSDANISTATSGLQIYHPEDDIYIMLHSGEDTARGGINIVASNIQLTVHRISKDNFESETR
ncbi:hypothetical protein V1477_009233 [Vespula maculifrons]|uniref:Uncharacterized protein n=1 Tax=Vespula maculifrons TaxID=7453 RepID=A0ABD2CC38_VESMC